MKGKNIYKQRKAYVIKYIFKLLHYATFVSWKAALPFPSLPFPSLLCLSYPPYLSTCPIAFLSRNISPRTGEHFQNSRVQVFTLVAEEAPSYPEEIGFSAKFKFKALRSVTSSPHPSRTHVPKGCLAETDSTERRCRSHSQASGPQR